MSVRSLNATGPANPDVPPKTHSQNAIGNVALVPPGVVNETSYVVPVFIWLGAHTATAPGVATRMSVPVKTTLLVLAFDRATFTEVAPLNWAPVIWISTFDGHDATPLSVASAVIDGTDAPKAQLKTVNVVPQVVLPSGEQLAAEMVLGKSSNSTTA